MNAVKKTTRQTFVTLRRYAAAVAVLVVDNRIASATPANGIRGKMHEFKTKYATSGRCFALFRAITQSASACSTRARGFNYVSVRCVSR